MGPLKAALEHPRSGKGEHRLHEALIPNLDPPIAVRVEPPERLGELLDDDARAHEAVERDSCGGGMGAAGRRRSVSGFYV